MAIVALWAIGVVVLSTVAQITYEGAVKGSFQGVFEEGSTRAAEAIGRQLEQPRVVARAGLDQWHRSGGSVPTSEWLVDLVSVFPIADQVYIASHGQLRGAGRHDGRLYTSTVDVESLCLTKTYVGEDTPFASKCDFDVSSRPWFTSGSDNNDDGDSRRRRTQGGAGGTNDDEGDGGGDDEDDAPSFTWTAPYSDFSDGGMMVTITFPLVREDVVFGSSAVDVRLSKLSELLERDFNTIGNAGHSSVFMLDTSTGAIAASSASADLDPAGTSLRVLSSDGAAKGLLSAETASAHAVLASQFASLESIPDSDAGWGTSPIGDDVAVVARGVQGTHAGLESMRIVAAVPPAAYVDDRAKAWLQSVMLLGSMVVLFGGGGLLYLCSRRNRHSRVMGGRAGSSRINALKKNRHGGARDNPMLGDHSGGGKHHKRKDSKTATARLLLPPDDPARAMTNKSVLNRMSLLGDNDAADVQELAAALKGPTAGRRDDEALQHSRRIVGTKALTRKVPIVEAALFGVTVMALLMVYGLWTVGVGSEIDVKASRMRTLEAVGRADATAHAFLQSPAQLTSMVQLALSDGILSLNTTGGSPASSLETAVTDIARVFSDTSSPVASVHIGLANGDVYGAEIDGSRVLLSVGLDNEMTWYDVLSSSSRESLNDGDRPEARLRVVPDVPPAFFAGSTEESWYGDALRAGYGQPVWTNATVFRSPVTGDNLRTLLVTHVRDADGFEAVLAIGMGLNALQRKWRSEDPDATYSKVAVFMYEPSPPPEVDSVAGLSRAAVAASGLGASAPLLVVSSSTPSIVVLDTGFTGRVAVTHNAELTLQLGLEGTWWIPPSRRDPEVEAAWLEARSASAATVLDSTSESSAQEMVGSLNVEIHRVGRGTGRSWVATTTVRDDNGRLWTLSLVLPELLFKGSVYEWDTVMFVLGFTTIMLNTVTVMYFGHLIAERKKLRFLRNLTFIVKRGSTFFTGKGSSARFSPRKPARSPRDAAPSVPGAGPALAHDRSVASDASSFAGAPARAGAGAAAASGESLPGHGLQVVAALSPPRIGGGDDATAATGSGTPVAEPLTPKKGRVARLRFQEAGREDSNVSDSGVSDLHVSDDSGSDDSDMEREQFGGLKMGCLRVSIDVVTSHLRPSEMPLRELLREHCFESGLRLALRGVRYELLEVLTHKAGARRLLFKYGPDGLLRYWTETGNDRLLWPALARVTEMDDEYASVVAARAASTAAAATTPVDFDGHGRDARKVNRLDSGGQSAAAAAAAATPLETRSRSELAPRERAVKMEIVGKFVHKALRGDNVMQELLISRYTAARTAALHFHQHWLWTLFASLAGFLHLCLAFSEAGSDLVRTNNRTGVLIAETLLVLVYLVDTGLYWYSYGYQRHNYADGWICNYVHPERQSRYLNVNNHTVSWYRLRKVAALRALVVLVVLIDMLVRAATDYRTGPPGFNFLLPYSALLRPLLALTRSSAMRSSLRNFMMTMLYSKNVFFLVVSLLTFGGATAVALLEGKLGPQALGRGFDNFRESLLTMFVFISSGENYADVVYPAAESGAWFKGYFILFSGIGTFLVVSILTASFQEFYGRELDRGRQAKGIRSRMWRRAGLLIAYHVLLSMPEPPKAEGDDDDDGTASAASDAGGEAGARMAGIAEAAAAAAVAANPALGGAAFVGGSGPVPSPESVSSSRDSLGASARHRDGDGLGDTGRNPDGTTVGASRETLDTRPSHNSSTHSLTSTKSSKGKLDSATGSHTASRSLSRSHGHESRKHSGQHTRRRSQYDMANDKGLAGLARRVAGPRLSQAVSEEILDVMLGEDREHSHVASISSRTTFKCASDEFQAVMQLSNRTGCDSAFLDKLEKFTSICKGLTATEHVAPDCTTLQMFVQSCEKEARTIAKTMHNRQHRSHSHVPTTDNAWLDFIMTYAVILNVFAVAFLTARFDELIPVVTAGFLVLYSAEMVRRVFVEGGLVEYWRAPAAGDRRYHLGDYQRQTNRFDMMVVCFAVFAFITAGIASAIAVDNAADCNAGVTSTTFTFTTCDSNVWFRAVACIPLLRLFSIIKKTRQLVFGLLGTLPDFYPLFGILAMVTYAYAVWGVWQFAGQLTALSEDVYGVQGAHFDSFSSAMATCFHLMTGEGWHEIMYGTIDALDSLAPCLFFMSYVLLVVLLFTQTFVGIVCDSFTKIQEEERVHEHRKEQLDHTRNVQTHATALFVIRKFRAAMVHRVRRRHWQKRLEELDPTMSPAMRDLRLNQLKLLVTRVDAGTTRDIRDEALCKAVVEHAGEHMQYVAASRTIKQWISKTPRVATRRRSRAGAAAQKAAGPAREATAHGPSSGRGGRGAGGGGGASDAHHFTFADADVDRSSEQ